MLEKERRLPNIQKRRPLRVEIKGMSLDLEKKELWLPKRLERIDPHSPGDCLEGMSLALFSVCAC